MLAWESCKYNSFSQYLLRKAEQTATDRLLMEKLVRTNFFAEYDKMGATVVFATSNNGYNPKTKKPFHYQADLLPTSLATDNSPYISVGGVVSNPFQMFPAILFCPVAYLFPLLSFISPIPLFSIERERETFKVIPQARSLRRSIETLSTLSALYEHVIIKAC